MHAGTGTAIPATVSGAGRGLSLAIDLTSQPSTTVTGTVTGAAGGRVTPRGA